MAILSGRITLAALILLAASHAFAWDGLGHQVVCLIAEDHVTPQEKAGIKELLGDANISDAEIANWAAQFRPDRPNTGPWHSADISVEA